jgi:hypothetical protein
MTDTPENTNELTEKEQEQADQLRDSRPVPGAGFRGALGRYLAAQDPGYGPRPRRLRVIAAGYLGAAGVLLALGLLQATGAL